jgi:mRNA-degrading endonuclease RelE of RelBE toxin-antitoxin system
MGQKSVPKYRLVFHRKAEKSLEGLDEKTKQRVLEDIRCLENFAGFRDHLDIVKMKGHEDFYRLRTGKLRTVFTVDKPSETIIVLKIEHRERAYE